MNKKRVVIGLGTGRCGSVSLGHLLDAQDGAEVSHESRPMLPWQRSEAAFARKWRELEARKGDLVGDVCHSWLPYVSDLIRLDPEVRIVCLQRDCAKIVDSFELKVARKRKNHWMEHDGRKWTKDARYDPTFPKYPVDDMREALALYCRDYYARVDELICEYPGNIRKWTTEEALNSPEGMRDILDFIGIPRDIQVASVGEVHNKSRQPDGERKSLGRSVKNMLKGLLGRR
ncbi:MAG: hypothetical protein HGA75_02890 [Thiobacillus sp.]|nr:hypothetical protein [Thiobacillus sp.]